MNNTHTDDQIPTLNDIIQLGDESMKNHFDTRYFDDEHGMDDESMAADSVSQQNLRETIAVLIQDALNETMPVIEEQLKQQLTQKVLEKLAQDDTA